jgi:hypothetical protein
MEAKQLITMIILHHIILTRQLPTLLQVIIHTLLQVIIHTLSQVIIHTLLQVIIHHLQLLLNLVIVL